jgi:hypothetical protein
MDLQAAARESFTTGRPCSFVCDDRGTGRAIEITVHPDGRVSGRPLDWVDGPPATPVPVEEADIWALPAVAAAPRGLRRFRKSARPDGCAGG